MYLVRGEPTIRNSNDLIIVAVVDLGLVNIPVAAAAVSAKAALEKNIPTRDAPMRRSMIAAMDCIGYVLFYS